MPLRLRSDAQFLAEVSGWPLAAPLPCLVPVPIGPVAFGMFQPRDDELVCEYGPKVHHIKLKTPIILRMQASY